MTGVCKCGSLAAIDSMLRGLMMICVLLSSCTRGPFEAEITDTDALASARKNIGVSKNSEGLLKGTRRIEPTRISFYLVNGFYDACGERNMALELRDKNEISEFLVLLHKNAEYPRLTIDQRKRHEMVVAIYGTNNAEIIDSVIYISRGYDDMTAWYEAYVETARNLSWDICGAGKTVNELEGWIKEKKIDLWSVDEGDKVGWRGENRGRVRTLGTDEELHRRQ